MWQYTGKDRPQFAIIPKAGQESVWDYPRPPRLELDSRRVVVKHNEQIIAQSSRCYRVLETASPPTFYIPPADIEMDLLQENTGSSFCEWKGTASYFNLHSRDSLIENVGWCYHSPFPAFEKIRDYLCFYPSKLDCYVDGDRVLSQASPFYGGWITPEIVGPFKGDPGTEGW